MNTPSEIKGNQPADANISAALQAAPAIAPDEVRAFREGAIQNGYPLVPVRTNDKIPSVKGWQRGVMSGLLLNPRPYALNTGVLAGHVRVVDIDVSDRPKVQQILTAVQKHLPRDMLIRVRDNSPKLSLYYRAAEGAPPKRVIAGPKNDKGEQDKIEILGSGQQSVIHGIHPSGVPYRWHRGRTPATTPLAQVPAVTEGQLTTFLHECASIIGASGEHTPKKAANTFLEDPSLFPSRAAAAEGEELGENIEKPPPEPSPPKEKVKEWCDFLKSSTAAVEELGKRDPWIKLGFAFGRHANEHPEDAEFCRGLYMSVSAATAPPGKEEAYRIEAENQWEDAVKSTKERRDKEANWQSIRALARKYGYVDPSAAQGDQSGAAAAAQSNQAAAPAPQAKVVVYKPGTEGECRKVLDEVVAVDPRAYTVGGQSGPLAFLRVPDKDTMPEGASWEGDLPGTTLAMPADIVQCAERITWQAPRRTKGDTGAKLVRIHPPRQFVADYIIQMRGRYSARPLVGIVRLPRMDDQGEIHFICGYDPQTGLFHDQTPTFDVPPDPSRDDVEQATRELLFPFSKYQFEDSAAGRALTLTAIFTAIQRPFLLAAPMFVVRSSMPGTGKGLFVKSLAYLAFNTRPAVITWGGNSEEFEKRFASMLLQSPGALCIDNANGMLIQGDLLEAFLTEGSVDIRPLGRSELIRVRSRAFTILTGNNAIITGDMARRALALDVVPKSADPERDQYEFDPVGVIQERRTDLLLAAYAIMRAYRRAGMPDQRLPAVGSFGEWSRKVRDLVHWLTGIDIGEGFQRNKQEDPRRQNDAELLAALHDKFGSAQFKSNEVMEVYIQGHNSATGGVTADKEGAVRGALNEVFGAGKVGVKTFGHWARRVKGAHIGGLVLDVRFDAHTKTNAFVVRRK